ncbi:hypothetical protein B0H14DRAFT_3521026 [Mycena olivaceomarginata]|nr:hypothetical protein B0H14DRAFT_3521026 [Mycena olivaceomarginata]
MVGKEWTTPEEKAHLMALLPSYHKAAGARNNEKTLGRFWTMINESFFAEFPSHNSQPGPTKRHLRSWFRYRTSRRGIAALNGNRTKDKCSLFTRLQKPRKKRALQAVEVYHKLHHDKVHDELMRRDYGELNEEAVARRAEAEAAEAALEAGLSKSAVEVLTPEEQAAKEARDEAEIDAQVANHRKLRMIMQRSTVEEMFEAETDDVKADVHDEMLEINAKRAASEDDEEDGERGPEEFQDAIDQLSEVVERVLQTIGEETGWSTCVMVGGPMPRRQGAISIKTFCLGTTPSGSDFQVFHLEFEGQVKVPFGQFLKRAYPHDVRNARKLVPDAEDPNTDDPNADDPNILDTEGLLTIDPDKETPKSKPPKAKHMCRTQKPAAVAAPPIVPAPAAPAPAVSAPAPSSLAPSATIDSLSTADDDFALPSLTLGPSDETLPIPPGFDPAMFEITSDSDSFGFGDAWTEEEDEESFKTADLGSTAYIPPTFDAAGEDIAALASSQSSNSTRPPPQSFQVFGADRVPGDFGMAPLRLSLATAEPRAPRPLLPEGQTMKEIFRPSTYFQAFVRPPVPAPAPASTFPSLSQLPSPSLISVATATLTAATSTAGPTTSQSFADAPAAKASSSVTQQADGILVQPVPTPSPLSSLPPSFPPEPTSSQPVPTSSPPALTSSPPVLTSTPPAPPPSKFPESRPPVNPTKPPAAKSAPRP